MTSTDVVQLAAHMTAKSTSGLDQQGTAEIAVALRMLLADAYALYLKTKGFHWHMSGSHFRDYHLLLDEQAEQLFSMTDDVAERARKLGESTLRSIGDIARHQRLADNEREDVSAEEMLQELLDDNGQFTGFLREAHKLADHHGDIATASLLENWVDQAERRSWFLAETLSTRPREGSH